MFFFQAEDGIRDLVRSRGLGDVYKRQVMFESDARGTPSLSGFFDFYFAGVDSWLFDIAVSVSYTHLTLPTSDLV